MTSRICAAVHGDRELLARKMRRTNKRTLAQVANPQRVVRGTEVERTTKADPVDGPHERTSVTTHRRERQQSHARETIAGLTRYDDAQG
jgi:hypothetical protein